MFPSDSSPTDAPRPSGEMLFLIGHGLQTPLSAIRWGCNRLAKMSRDSMTPEQMHVLEGIHDQAKILSGMLNTLLLVARVEDGTYVSRVQDIYLRDFLMSFGPLHEAFDGKAAQITCPKNLLIHADRGVIEAMFQAIAVILATAASHHDVIHLDIVESETGCTVSILPPVELSLFRQMSELEEHVDPQQLVGGAPGLMLSIAQSLSSFLGGSIDVLKVDENRHALVLQLPIAQPSEAVSLSS